MQQHQSGENTKSYTYSRRPVKLVFWQAFQEPSKAIEFEKQIKGWIRRKKEALIERNWEKLKEFAKCLNETSHKKYNK